MASISAFAFQGTNAHAIVGTSSRSFATGTSDTCIWRRKRAWCVYAHAIPSLEINFNSPSLGMLGIVAPIDDDKNVSMFQVANVQIMNRCVAFRYDTTISHLMLSRCTVSASVMKIEAMVSTNACGYLLDHVVSGKAILPGAAMMEAAAAASRAALSKGSLVHDALDDNFVLLSASILAPFVLPSPASSTTAILMTEVYTLSSQVAQFSRRGIAKDNFQHFKGSIASSATKIGFLDTSVAIRTRLVYFTLPYAQDAGVALGSMQQSLFKTEQAGQHLLHPALLDNSMQASASLIGTPTPAAPTQTRVPIGLQVCRLCQTMSQAQAWASASIVALHTDGNVTCDIKLVTLPEADQSARLFDMLFKPATRMAGSNRHDTIAMAPVQHHLYILDWQAMHVRTQVLDFGHFQPRSSVWQGVNAHQRTQWQFFTTRSTLLTSAASGLRLIQMLQNQRSVRLINAVNAPPLAGQAPLPKLNYCMHDAALVGLLRVASLERSSMHWHHILRSPYDSKGLIGDPMVQQADAFGVCMEGGLWYLPMLNIISRGDTTTLQKGNIRPNMSLFIENHTRATVVIGGLGGIGSVYSACMIARQFKKPLLLVSRSGRRKNTFLGDGSPSEGLLCLLRCDVACSEETAIFASNSALLQYPLQSVVHAGGVVMDKSVKDQVCHLSSEMW